MNYRIKPLEWEYRDTSRIYTDVEKEWMAITGLAYFTIQKHRNDDELLVKSVFSNYDYTYYSANSLEEAKELCKRVWIESIEKCLIKEKEG